MKLPFGENCRLGGLIVSALTEFAGISLSPSPANFFSPENMDRWKKIHVERDHYQNKSRGPSEDFYGMETFKKLENRWVKFDLLNKDCVEK